MSHAPDAELSTLFQVLGRFPDVKLTPLGEVLREEVNGHKKKVPKQLAPIVLPPGLIFAPDKGAERAAKLKSVKKEVTQKDLEAFAERLAKAGNASVVRLHACCVSKEEDPTSINSRPMDVVTAIVEFDSKAPIKALLDMHAKPHDLAAKSHNLRVETGKVIPIELPSLLGLGPAGGSGGEPTPANSPTSTLADESKANLADLGSSGALAPLAVPPSSM
jgi:hypothetical protein